MDGTQNNTIEATTSERIEPIFEALICLERVDAIADLVEICGNNEVIDELKKHSLATAMRIVSEQTYAAKEFLENIEEQPQAKQAGPIEDV